MSRKLMICAVLVSALWLGACTRHQVQVEPIRTEHVVEVKPMEMTINVNVNVRVDKALDDFFGDLDATTHETDQTEKKGGS